MPSAPWKRWKKPWSIEQCRGHYVHYEGRIDYKILAEHSGVPVGTLKRWSTKDPDGGWAVQRERHKTNLRPEIDRKVIEKTSEIIGNELAELAAEHFKLHKSARQVAALYFNMKAKILSQAQFEGLDALVKEFEKTNSKDLNNFSLVLDRHTKGERIATGLEYEDINKAIAAVNRAGYEVSEGGSDDEEKAEE